MLLDRRRVLVCVEIRPGQDPAPTLLRAAVAALQLGEAAGGILLASWSVRGVRKGLSLEAAVMLSAAARLLGGMRAATGEGVMAATTVRPKRSWLSSCFENVRKLQGLGGLLGRDRLQVQGANGPRLQVGGEVNRTRAMGIAAANHVPRVGTAEQSGGSVARLVGQVAQVLRRLKRICRRYDF